MMKYLSYIVLILFMFSCNSAGDNPKVNAKYEVVMQLHDEVMAHTRTLRNLKKDLKKSINANTSPDDKNLINNNIETIIEAQEEMMAWMKDFKLNKEKSVADQIKYLESEEVKMELIKEKTNRSISDAKEILNSTK